MDAPGALISSITIAKWPTPPKYEQISICKLQNSNLLISPPILDQIQKFLNILGCKNGRYKPKYLCEFTSGSE